ncbi:MAG TPA: hypothetical protein VKV40_06920 [Ktedonobacteraceae bacterium]|nr:hypothetical protein [Ktedonobacteraceae bacterium]
MSLPRRSKVLALVAGVTVLLMAAQFFILFHNNSKATTVNHYLYVFPEGQMDVYNIDNNFALVKTVSMPMLNEVRGVDADPASASLYIAYGGDGGAHGNGSLLKYNLLTNSIVWSVNYPFGVDSPAITPDGKTIYLPDGELSYDGTWHIINTSNGSVEGSIFVNTGAAPHNTVVSLDGAYAYLGSLNYNYLVQVSTATNKITERIGPLVNGVRPFTINSADTFAFTTATGYLGFQVSSIKTGKVLYTVPVKGFSIPPSESSLPPSHGISLSPDEKQLYVMDNVNYYVHVFDISGLPNSAPVQIANIPLRSMAGNQSPCDYDCSREGWILHSSSGQYAFIGDSGDIINTATQKSIMNLSSLYNSRVYIEVDWTNGAPSYTTTRYGLGHANTFNPTPTPTATSTASPTSTPTPGVIAQDTFQRANQQYWGTASDGLKWGGDANSQSIFSIHNDTGQITNGSGPYNAVLGPTATDAEVLFTGSMSSFNNTNLGAVLRWRDTNDWYKAYIDGAHLVVQKKVNGTTTILSQVNFSATTNTLYNLRFEIVGTTLYAKVWAASTTEPSSWMITTSDSTLSSGQCGLRVQVLSGTTATVTSFVANSLP